MKIIFLLSFLLSYGASQWVDPHDMNTNAKEKYVKSTLKRSSSTPSLNNEEINIDTEICFSHLKRIIAVLLNSAHIDKRDPEMYHGHIRFNVVPEDLDFLMALGKDSMALDKLRRLDTILSESFKKSFINEYLDKIEFYQLKLYSVVVNIQNLWILGTVCLLYVVYQLFKNNFSFSYIIKYLIIIVLIADFGLRYQHLLEEVEEHNASISYSSKCDPAKMTWTEWSKFWFSNRDCERKTITPLDAFLYQVKNLIIIPMHAFGTGMGGFGYNMFSSLPWGLNLIMWPLMLIFVIIIFVFTMVIYTGQAIEFNIFHLIKLKFGGTRPVSSENVLTGSTVERLMDKLHRPMVQNITLTVPSEDKREVQASTTTSALQQNANDVVSRDKVKSICDESTVVRATDDNTEKIESEDTDIILSENSPHLRSSDKGNSQVETPSKLETSKVGIVVGTTPFDNVPDS